MVYLFILQSDKRFDPLQAANTLSAFSKKLKGISGECRLREERVNR